MKPIILILTTFSITTTLSVAEMQPKVIKAYDRVSPRKARVVRGAGPRQDDLLLSTIDATAQISIQVSSVLAFEASTQATSEEPQRQRRGRRYSQLKFLKDNKIQIKQNIAQGSGEYLSALLNMMSIKQTPSTLAKIQSDFDVLASLDDEAFLSKLGEIINS
ncbi:MAG: DUF3015 domain-containing protein [Epsilonproteobacteria bacterium]|nr:DUF3015 domain-containing protein [Campylobacterota bacterium]